jgi:threonine/homoserine/homoserine lactone efflux protein
VGDAIGQILPTAVGVAISPLPIVAVVLMLVTPRGRVNGPAFVLGWIVGLAIVGAVVLAVASGASASDDGEPATWTSILKLVLGVLALLLGVKQFRGRPHGDAEPETPKWMRALDAFTPVKAAGTAVLLSGVNPKNLLLAAAGALAIAQTGIDAGEQAIAYAVFVLIATAGVAAPVLLALVLGERSRELLDRLKAWLSENNAVIMAVLLIVIGAKLIGDGISGF